jgi:large subunit ribosomal protein L20
MARVKTSITTRKVHKKVISRASGYWGRHHRNFRSANEAVMHALKYAYRDRRARKGDFRKLWILRINAALRERGLSYSKFIGQLNKLGIEINRKMLADLAVKDPEAFNQLIAHVQASSPLGN